MKTYWTCTNCHDQIEDVYDACWNCQHDRDGNLRVDLTEGLAIDDHAVRQDLTEKWKDKNCAHCKTPLTYVGSKGFHEGLQWGMLGDLAEAFENQLMLEMYLCRQCRRVEFFY